MINPLNYAKLSSFMNNSPFYASGLRFSCARCSSCCRYDSGFVYLTEKDLQKLMAVLESDRNTFINTYCRWVSDQNGGKVLSLKEKANNDCILWETSGCSVYSARPVQCITFPFWKSIMASQKSWEMAASGCPGMNTGKTYSGKEINDVIKLRTSSPIINRAVHTGTGG